MTSKQIRAKIERSSLGTKSAQAARRSVSNAAAGRVVARSQSGTWTSKKTSKKSGG